MSSAPQQDSPIRARSAILLCFISGLFGALLFNHDALGLLAWVALVPLFVAIHHIEGKTLAWGTLLFGFTWYYLSLFWLHTIVVFHWIIPLGVVAGAVYCALFFLLFAFPAAWCCRNLSPAARPWAIAACWTAVEYLRGFSDMAFPWNLLGHSQAPINKIHMGLASTGGVYLISFLVALINAALAVGLVQWFSRRAGFGSGFKPILLPVLFGIIVTFWLGEFNLDDDYQGQTLKVAIIQPGISQVTKWNAMMGLPGDTDAAYQQRYRETDILMQETLGSLIDKAATKDKVDLVVLPESVFLSGYFPYETALHEELTSLSRRINADLFFGADNRIDRRLYDEAAAGGQRFLSPDDKPTIWPLAAPPARPIDNVTTPAETAKAMAVTNAAWQVSPENGLEARVYNKMQLVPFGETVPFVAGFAWLRNHMEVAGIAGAFMPGLENTIFEVDGAKFGAVICFESTFNHLTRHLARAGAQFICVLTNDSWYDPQYAIDREGLWGSLFEFPGIHYLVSAGPKQHFVHSQFRAIETRMPVVRSANTGVSAFIDAKGEYREPLPYGQSGAISQEIVLHPDGGKTISVQYGEWVAIGSLGLWIVTLASMLVVRFLRFEQTAY